MLKTLDSEREAAESAAASDAALADAQAGSAGGAIRAGEAGGADAIDVMSTPVPSHWLTCVKCQARVPERVASCSLCAKLLCSTSEAASSWQRHSPQPGLLGVESHALGLGLS